MILTTSVLAAHFIGDFMCQPRSWANTKHKNPFSLMKHVGVYTLALFAVAMVNSSYIPPKLLLMWAIINGIMHYIVDHITSRLFHKYWERGNHAVAIKIFGLDQFIHYTCLFGTLGIMP